MFNFIGRALVRELAETMKPLLKTFVQDVVKEMDANTAKANAAKLYGKVMDPTEPVPSAGGAINKKIGFV